MLPYRGGGQGGVRDPGWVGDDVSSSEGGTSDRQDETYVPQAPVQGMDILQQILAAMQALAGTARGGNQAPEPREAVAMREFRQMDPPTFSGEPDPA
ncbi:hypothetical protein U1Q18_000340, partial [Sarracenia purpurea var. burkii]